LKIEKVKIEKKDFSKPFQFSILHFHLINPHFRSFGTIGADLDGIPVFQYRIPE